MPSYGVLSLESAASGPFEPSLVPRGRLRHSAFECRKTSALAPIQPYKWLKLPGYEIQGNSTRRGDASVFLDTYPGYLNNLSMSCMSGKVTEWCKCPGASSRDITRDGTRDVTRDVMGDAHDAYRLDIIHNTST